MTKKCCVVVSLHPMEDGGKAIMSQSSNVGLSNIACGKHYYQCQNQKHTRLIAPMSDQQVLVYTAYDYERLQLTPQNYSTKPHQKNIHNYIKVRRTSDLYGTNHYHWGAYCVPRRLCASNLRHLFNLYVLNCLNYYHPI